MDSETITMQHDHPTFCPLLFQHLATHPFGGVSQCCIAHHSYSTSLRPDGSTKYHNLIDDSIDTIMNGDTLRQARLQSLDGVWPSGCQRCKDDEAKGVESKRQFEIKSYPDFTWTKAREITDSTGYIEDIQFDFIELRLGNTCNVKCIMCNPWSSSKWYGDFEELGKKLSWDIGTFRYADHQLKWSESESVWHDIFNHCKNIKTIYINGGEPTLNKAHRQFLRMLIERGMTDVELRYNINLTGLPLDLLDIWKNFNNLNIGCSIDDLGSRNHYIRYPTEWLDVLRNIDTIVSLGYNFNITQTINWMNYLSVGEFYQYWCARFGEHVNVIHNPVFWPTYLSPHVLPHDFRSMANDILSHQLDSRRFNTLVKTFDRPFDERKWSQAKEYIVTMDKIRGTKFLDHFPEFTGYFDALE